MSDVMLFGVLRMPMEMAMADDLSRMQFYQRAQQAADRIEELEQKLRDARDEIERLQAHNGLMKAAIEEFGEVFNQKPVASVKDDFERVNAALKDSWKERERLRDVLTEQNARIATLEAENERLKRTEAHITGLHVTTLADWQKLKAENEALKKDAARATSSPETSAPSRPEECQSLGKTVRSAK